MPRLIMHGGQQDSQKAFATSLFTNHLLESDALQRGLITHQCKLLVFKTRLTGAASCRSGNAEKLPTPACTAAEGAKVATDDRRGVLWGL
jgi:hypothetical protein